MDINYYKQFEPIDGKWYITKELGSGSFGTVFEIERKDYADMKAALKIISVPSSQSEVDSFREENYDLDEKSLTSYFYGFVEEFVKEFRIMSQLKGQSNIVSYEDHDVIQRDEGIGWDIFIRMELLTPMSKYFASNTPKQSDVIKLGIDICKALEVCQKYQIIHRDIKPSNIFVSDTGDFKLGDFGVARTLEKTSSSLSKKGTYTYMAPEVFKGEKYSPNVDIYSLGIVMYKLLNNNLEPFRTDRTYADSEKAMEQRMSGVAMPKPLNAEDRLANIILKACSYNPKDRYDNPTQMRIELENIIYGMKSNEDSINNKIITSQITESNIEIEEEETVSLMDEETGKTTGMFSINQHDETKDKLSKKAVTNTNLHQNFLIQENVNENNDKPLNFEEFVESYKNFWKKIFDFRGTTGRKEFWILTFINIISIYVANFLSRLPFIPIVIAACVLFFGCIVAGISLGTRRLHDVGKSGHWQWLYLTAIGTIVVLIFFCQKTKTDSNKYKLN